MEKSEFLTKISSMTREEIQEQMNRDCKRVKLICPAVYIKRKPKIEERKDEVNG